MQENDEEFSETIDRYMRTLNRIIKHDMCSTKSGNKFKGALLKSFIGDDEIKRASIDIETTGLSKIYNKITCISILFDEYDCKNKIIQLINSNRIGNLVIWNGEYPISICNLNKISFDYVFKHLVCNIEYVTYNGTSFDIPFMKSKYGNFDTEYHIDMRYILKNCDENLCGGQKAIEKLLKFNRNDIECVDGLDAIRLYNKFEIGNNKRALVEFLGYAFADVEGLRRITNWYDENYE